MHITLITLAINMRNDTKKLWNISLDLGCAGLSNGFVVPILETNTSRFKNKITNIVNVLMKPSRPLYKLINCM